MRTLLLLAALALPLFAQQSIITGQSLGTLSNTVPGGMDTCLGTGITINTPMVILSLGRWIVAGNSQTHALYLWDLVNSIPLGTVTLNTMGQTAGQYAYVALGSSVSRAPGDGVAVASFESTGGDQWYADDTTITTTADGTVSGSREGAPTCGPYTTNLAGSRAYGPVSFRYVGRRHNAGVAMLLWEWFLNASGNLYIGSVVS